MDARRDGKPVDILLVEDSSTYVRLLQAALADAESDLFLISHVGRLGDALARLSQEHFDLVLLDLFLPDSEGLETFLRLRDRAPSTPTVVLSARSDRALAVRTVQAGAQDYLVKGQVDRDLLTRSIRYAIERHRLLTEYEKVRREQLEMKDRFLSHVSHELRSPLAASYLGVTHMLDGFLGDLSPAQREYLEAVLKHIKHLRAMVDDLLEVARADAGQLNIVRRSVSLSELIPETVGMLKAVAGRVRLLDETPAHLAPVYADPKRVRQILTNLCDNAIKFTAEKGTIRVRAYPLPSDPEFLCVEVADNGRGISPEARQHIFERLYQESHAEPGCRTGLGLGLHICQQLVSGQGGRIWVESEPGRGSRFFFTLPLFPAHASEGVIKRRSHRRGQVDPMTRGPKRRDGPRPGQRQFGGEAS